MEKVTDKCKVEAQSGKIVAYGCGHRYQQSFALNFWGETKGLREDYLAKREKCGDCLLEEQKKLTIRCVTCGFGIFPGDPVAIPGTRGPFNDKWLEDSRGYRYTCLRMICGNPFGLTGHWNGRGVEPIMFGGGGGDGFEF